MTSSPGFMIPSKKTAMGSKGSRGELKHSGLGGPFLVVSEAGVSCHVVDE